MLKRVKGKKKGDRQPGPGNVDLVVGKDVESKGADFA
jgi:hypothetical protein